MEKSCYVFRSRNNDDATEMTS